MRGNVEVKPGQRWLGKTWRLQRGGPLVVVSQSRKGGGLWRVTRPGIRTVYIYHEDYLREDYTLVEDASA